MKKAIENKKVLLGLLTVLLTLAIVVVSSFWPFILDPNKLDTKKFLTDELTITAIVLSVTVSIMLVAQASNANNPKSDIAKAKVEFANSMNLISSRTGLHDWIKGNLQKRDKDDLARLEMEKLEIPFSVYELSDKEIKNLQGYEKKKLKKVIHLKKTIKKIKFVDPTYYTTVKSYEKTKNLSQIASGESVKKTLTVVIQLISRIIFTWVIAAIIGSLVRDLTQEGGSNAQVWMTFLSRIFAFGSSCFMGYNLGCKLNDLDAFYIIKRVEVHKLYLESEEVLHNDQSQKTEVGRTDCC